MVVRGRARGVVESIGLGTAVGRLARDVTELAPGLSPLQVRMALVMAGLGLGAFTWALSHDWEVEAARNLLLYLFVILQIVHIGNCRSETRSAFAIPPWRNPVLMGGSLIALGLHLSAMVMPLGHRFLHTQPLALSVAGGAVAASLLLLVVMEAQKLLHARRDSH